jgi:Tfp pilus assembly protein PilE
MPASLNCRTTARRLIRRVHRDQSGFGLIELLIALMLMNIAIFALFTAFDAGATTLLRAERTSTAATLGEKQLELYRAMLWNNIGLNSTALASTDSTHQGDADWVSQASQTSVTACNASATPECQPTQSSVTGPDKFQYRIDTYIRTLTSAGGGITGGRTVKRVVVSVLRQNNLTAAPVRMIATFDQSTGCDDTSTNPC